MQRSIRGKFSYNRNLTVTCLLVLLFLPHKNKNNHSKMRTTGVSAITLDKSNLITLHSGNFWGKTQFFHLNFWMTKLLEISKIFNLIF